MCGSIMPAPLAKPVTVTVRSAPTFPPPSAAVREVSLGTVSVVMMPRAALDQSGAESSAIALAARAPVFANSPLAPRASSLDSPASRAPPCPSRREAASSIPPRSRSSGSICPITPVENGSTDAPGTPSACPTASQCPRATAMPGSPVPALALPEFTSSARTAPALASRCSRATVTGAAANALCVNTAAQALPSARRISTRSVEPSRLMPQAAVASSTPATG